MHICEAAADIGEGSPSRLIETAASRRRALEQLADAMRATDPSGATHEFISYARTWWTAAHQRLTEHCRQWEQLLSAAMFETEHLTPPRSLRDSHDNLESGLRNEYQALATFHRGLLNLNAQDAATAYDDATVARTQIRTATTAIFATISNRRQTLRTQLASAPDPGPHHVR